MRILHVSNHSAPRCGIQNFGYQVTTALRRAGAEVTDWDGSYQAIYEKPYLPPDAADYDVIHVNWHPVTINHYHADHFPSGPVLSVYLNDLPPWSSCPFGDQAAVRFAPEPHPGCAVLPYPIADWIDDLPEPPAEFTVGWSGVRGDGADLLRKVCDLCGYATNAPDGVWRSFEDEVRRQARSTINVLWYHEARGISGGASQAAAAKRPIVLNGSRMFQHFWPYADEVHRFPHRDAPTAWRPDQRLDVVLKVMQDHWRHGQLRQPTRILTDLGWTRAADRMLSVWEAAR